VKAWRKRLIEARSPTSWPAEGDRVETFTEVYDIIELKCGGGDFGCHVMGESGGLNMSSQEEAYTNLVDVDGENCPDKRVVAGDADASLIIERDNRCNRVKPEAAHRIGDPARKRVDPHEHSGNAPAVQPDRRDT
jgi:hypothetical protein